MSVSQAKPAGPAAEQADGKTREIFWGMPDWLVAAWYVLAMLSVLVFAYGVLRPVAK